MQLDNNQYHIQGIPVAELCSTYGTPLYVYNGARIVSQYHRLKEAFIGVNVKIKYAVKALTNQAILKILRQEGAGIDVVSIQELQLGLMAGFSPTDIMFTPNCVAFEEIKAAVMLGVTINIDNLPFLEKFGQEYGSNYPICIRLNPHIEAGGNVKIMTGHKASKFGISIDQINEVYEIAKKYKLQISGVHVHSGSDFKSADAFIKASEVLFGVARNFEDLKFIDFGSGFKVAYKPNDHATDIEELGKKMSQHFQEFCKSYGKELELWFEPGKFLVSESGYLFCRANVVKPTPACTFVGLDTGLNHLIRPMMYGAYHSILNVSQPHAEKENYTIVGYICETDTFGTDIELSKVKEGDLIGILNAGAYGFSMSSNYNSRFRPAEVLVLDGKHHLIRRRETMEDLLRNQVEIDV
ncbi:MAG: diaminopimelate decarboxylase [Cytophagales bacterium]|nr:MAG: diaminopimelate decarboxylase [Cytophagales bacterium]